VNLLDARNYWLTRLLLERGIALICLIAFIVALNQFRPLLGERGLLPVPLFIRQVPFRESPSLFYLFPRDVAFTLAAWLGIVLSVLLVSGMASRYTWSNIASWAAVYLLYLSFVNVGQTFYAFGWESILLEACFFAIFLGGSQAIPQVIPVWLFRWLLFRIMFGAGLIKLRGDSCWHDLTCLNYHYETQPMPNPLSWYLHWAPQWTKTSGVLFNHFAELIVPFFYFLPQPFAGIAGVITILFQLSIIISGNLSWLNWLTLILAFSLFDAKVFSGLTGLDSRLSSDFTGNEIRELLTARRRDSDERSGSCQYAFRRPNNEHKLQLAALSRDLRRIWQHRTHTLRSGSGGSRRRGDYG
jgi:hypothetical protein